VAARASLLVFTAEQARRMYLERYPALASERCQVIGNGYDEADFARLPAAPARQAGGPVRMLHAGLIYPEERDPRPLFRALGRLAAEGRIGPDALQLRLRASGSEDRYAPKLAELGLERIVHLLPAIPYRQALTECLEADALLILQGPSCNHQIPAKAYEYVRAGRPILALTAESGETATLLCEVGGATIVDIDDEQAIYRALPAFLARVRARSHELPAPERVRRYARESQAVELARRLDALVTPPAATPGAAVASGAK
jgi:glycosyltransferase involved in cell wall biosynthesis